MGITGHLNDTKIQKVKLRVTYIYKHYKNIAFIKELLKSRKKGTNNKDQT